MRASALLPESLLRQIDRLRTWSYLRGVRGVTAEYVARHGLAVKSGPFAGLRYPEQLESAPGDLVAKLLGSYERELHGVFAEWIAAGHPQVIDVGCAEGYYAVGLALAMPGTTVDAYDIDPAARARCGALAELNAVHERVRLRSACEPATLADYPERGVALLADCEGYERILLDPTQAPRLRGWPILVELHEFLDPEITETIRRRFADSHEVEIIEGEGREGDGMQELDFTSAGRRAAVFGERRPGPMRWAHLRPR
jgi:hypothetical protein